MTDIAAEPFPFRLDAARAALLIIDMQRDFLEPSGFGELLGNDVTMLRRAIQPNRRLLHAWRAAGLMVIHTREGHRPDLTDLPASKKSRSRGALGIGDQGPMGPSYAGRPGMTSSPNCIRRPESRWSISPAKGPFLQPTFTQFCTIAISPNWSSPASLRKSVSTRQ
ncbi:hypothetical protein MPC1_6330003 [Methylocella tundrae]|nr:hypothetical protein MPC1_6330003 [Methylocella tundrae]